MANENNIMGTSWPDRSLLVAGKTRAKRLGLSFSKYVAKLVEDDLRKGGPLTIIPLDDVEPPSEEVKKKLRKTKFPDRK